MKATTLLSIIKSQGIGWLAFRLQYALKMRARWFQWRIPATQWDEHPRQQSLPQIQLLPSPEFKANLGSDESVRRANAILQGRLYWYSFHEFANAYPPNWFFNPHQPQQNPPDVRHWSQISDFAGADIKGVWEQNRFGFVNTLVRAYARTGQDQYAEGFWRAVEDWRANNHPQRGQNWKCGQEVALRAIVWCFGALAFRDSPESTPQRQSMLRDMLRVSAHRIISNLSYALSQKNNHGVSEATGLFTIGIFLQQTNWIQRGQKLLEKLAQQLIYDDGSFCQHSTNYHRLVLHLYLWAIRLGEVTGHRLSANAIQRVRRAGVWLMAILHDDAGRVPNLGPNDGAHLLDLTDLGYLDYRPTIQAVAMVIDHHRWLPAGPWDELSFWLGVSEANQEECPLEAAVPKTEVPEPIEFPDGGYVVWRRESLTALLRCPRRFRHRPTQCDLLHFDLWYAGRNLLRDAGSYSYNCEEPWQSYFTSSAAHNTVEFDGLDQMPKLTRFLYGSWPECSVQRSGNTVTAAYQNYRGMLHSRTVAPQHDGFRVVDQLNGGFRYAILRWRLHPEAQWTIDPDCCRSEWIELHFTADRPVLAEIVEGRESLHYWEKHSLPVLELRVPEGCREITTEIRLVAPMPTVRRGESMCDASTITS